MQAAVKVLIGLARHPELLVVAFMVAIAGALVIPLPASLLDLLLVANLGLSLTLLISALHLSGPLALSTFPTLLLLATLFRLSLNVSSTRLILGEGAAGSVIAAFGQFVVGGSYIVGAIIFVIVLIVQLLVVAKGAERVAEVGARFTLDALPGKQMAIDADLRAGACDQEEASRRRAELGEESRFYGALDGAMKFVKGDAIAGVLITCINVIGGLTVGMAVHGLPAGEAAETFTLLSIGDGLVSQLPALLTAVAAGLVVTRVGAGGRLGADVVQQILAQPRALIASGAVLALMGLVPGLPALPFLALGCCGVSGGALSLRRDQREKEPLEHGRDGEDMSLSASPDGVSRPKVGDDPSMAIEDAPVVVLMDSGVSPSATSALRNDLLPEIRRRLARDLGLPLPPIAVVDNPRPRSSYRLLVHGVPALEGEVPKSATLETPLEDAKLLGFEKKTSSRPSAKATDDDVASQQASAITLDEEERGRASAAGLDVLSPEVVVARRIETELRARADELLSLETVQQLIDHLESRSPALVRELGSRLSIPLLWEVLVKLLEESVSIRPLDRILEALMRHGDVTDGPPSVFNLTEKARGALGRQLVHGCSSGTLGVVLLDPLLEDLLRQSRRETGGGAILALSPENQQRLAQAVRQELRGGAVLLAPRDLRRQLWAFVRGAGAEATVMAYQELPPDVRLQPLARLSIEPAFN